MVTADWVPDDSLTDSSGFVATEYLWAILDCPGAYASPEPATGAILLGESGSCRAKWYSSVSVEICEIIKSH